MQDFPTDEEIFQSTLPAGGATPKFYSRLNLPERFQSTLPAGGATNITANRIL